MWAVFIVFDALLSNKTSKLELSANNGNTASKEALSNDHTRENVSF